MNLLARLGDHISTKSNFIKASMWLFGLPSAILIAIVGAEYSPWMPVFALMLAPFAGYFWGLAMWHLHFQGVYALRSRDTSTQDHAE